MPLSDRRATAQRVGGASLCSSSPATTLLYLFFSLNFTSQNNPRDVTALGPASNRITPCDSHSPGYRVPSSLSPSPCLSLPLPLPCLSLSLSLLFLHENHHSCDPLTQSPGSVCNVTVPLLRTYYTLPLVTGPLRWNMDRLSPLLQTRLHAIRLFGSLWQPYTGHRNLQRG